MYWFSSWLGSFWPLTLRRGISAEIPTSRKSASGELSRLFSRYFEVSIWNLVYTFSRLHNIFNSRFKGMGSLWLQNSLALASSTPGLVFCLLLGVSSYYAHPITGQVTEVTCPVINRAQPKLTRSKRQKTDPGLSVCPSVYPVITWWLP